MAAKAVESPEVKPDCCCAVLFPLAPKGIAPDPVQYLAPQLVPCPIIHQKRAAIAKLLESSSTCGIAAQLAQAQDLDRLAGSRLQVSPELF